MKPTIKKCPNCDKNFSVKTAIVDRVKYCSASCRKEAVVKRNKNRNEIIIRNWSSKTIHEIAALCNTSHHIIKKKVTELRAYGTHLPNRDRGSYKPREKKATVPKPPKQPKEKVFHQSMQRVPRPSVQKLPNRVIDESKYHWVRLDSKSMVLRLIA